MAENNNDVWKRAVQLLTGFPLPDRSTLFNDLKGNDDIPLFHITLSSEEARYLTKADFEGLAGWNKDSVNYVIPFYSAPGDGAQKPMLRKAYITIITHYDAVPAGTDDLQDGTFTSTTLKADEGSSTYMSWDTSALAQYAYGSGAALKQLLDTHTTHGFSNRGASVPDEASVDLLTFNDVGKSFDRAVKYVADQRNALKDWEEVTIVGDDSWKGTGASMFEHLIHKMRRNYEGYDKQLGGVYSGTDASVDGSYHPSSNAGHAMVQSQRAVHDSAKALHEAWTRWQPLRSPQRWLYDMFVDLVSHLFVNNISKIAVAYSETVTTGYSGYYTSTRSGNGFLTQPGFRRGAVIAGKDYGPLDVMTTWQAIGQEAIKRWDTAAQQVLGGAAAHALVPIALAFHTSSTLFDKSLTDRDQSDLTSVLSGEQAEVELGKQTSDANATNDAYNDWLAAQAKADADAQAKYDEWQAAQAKADADAQAKYDEWQAAQAKADADAQAKYDEWQAAQAKADDEAQAAQAVAEADLQAQSDAAAAAQADAQAVAEADLQAQSDAVAADQAQAQADFQAQSDAAAAAQADAQAVAEADLQAQSDAVAADQAQAQADLQAQSDAAAADQAQAQAELQAQQELVSADGQAQADAAATDAGAANAALTSSYAKWQQDQEEADRKAQAERDDAEADAAAAAADLDSSYDQWQAEQNAAGSLATTSANADGSESQLNSDGTVTTTYPDGSAVTVDPSTGVVTETAADGTVTTSGVGGGGGYTAPSGATTVVDADGSLTTTFPDGSSTTIDPATGVTTTTGTDGAVTTTELTPVSGVTGQPDLSSAIPNADGSESQLNSDGTVTTTYPDGSAVTVDPSTGVVTETAADGTVTTSGVGGGGGYTAPSGATTVVDADGSLTTTFPDGSSTTIDPATGVTTTTGSDGGTSLTDLIEQRPPTTSTGIVTGVDGGSTVLNPDGSITTTFPDGSSTTIDPSTGLVTDVGADGSVAISDPDVLQDTLAQQIDGLDGLNTQSHLDSLSYDPQTGESTYGVDDSSYSLGNPMSVTAGSTYADGASSGSPTEAVGTGMPAAVGAAGSGAPASGTGGGGSPGMMPPGKGADNGNNERTRTVIDTSAGRRPARNTPSSARGRTTEEEENTIVTRGMATSSLNPMGMGGAGAPDRGQATESKERERSAWRDEDEDIWGTEEGGAPAALGR